MVVAEECALENTRGGGCIAERPTWRMSTVSRLSNTFLQTYQFQLRRKNSLHILHLHETFYFFADASIVGSPVGVGFRLTLNYRVYH